MEQLTIKESQARLLKIAKEFDKICRNHSVPYYMLGGTMLGAVRHKGFIPWDDDMDFGIPMTHYEALLEILGKELPKPYHLCTFLNHPGCGTAYAKIEDTTTCIADPRRNSLQLEEQMGLNIDLFPLVYCNAYDKKITKIKRLKRIYGLVFNGNAQGSKWKNTLKSVMQQLIWHNGTWYLNKQYELLKEFNEEGQFLANLFGRWGEREIMCRDVYGKETRYRFEDTEFCGAEHYDKYLSLIYGDYMTPPPPHQQVSHADRVYLR